jgi:predicted PurR-regulated permease PerM
MGLFDKRSAQAFLTLLLIAAALGFVYMARKTLIVFLFAMLFAYLLGPLVTRVQRLTRNSRAAAIAVVYVALAAVLVLIGFLIGPRVVSEVHKLTQLLPDLYQKISSGTIAWQVGAQRGWSRETQAEVQRFLAAHRDEVNSVIRNIGSRLALLATNAGWLLLVLILGAFFLKNESQLRGLVAGAVDELLLDVRKRELVNKTLKDLDAMLAQYVRAQLLLVLLAGTAYTLFLALLGVQYAFALGPIGGILEFIPVVGPLLAAGLIMGVSFSLGYPHLLVVAAFLGGWRICADYVIAPRIYGGKVDISPLAVIFGLLAGGEVAGVIGIYLATPALATIRILWRNWLVYSRPHEREGELIESKR